VGIYVKQTCPNITFQRWPVWRSGIAYLSYHGERVSARVRSPQWVHSFGIFGNFSVESIIFRSKILLTGASHATFVTTQSYCPSISPSNSRTPSHFKPAEQICVIIHHGASVRAVVALTWEGSIYHGAWHREKSLSTCDIAVVYISRSCICLNEGPK
jgi:hypothetical protein